MQPVNDDMDHLFRQAANDYLLNTQGGDFDKLQQRMQAPEAEVLPKKERRQRYSLLLLLLVALPFVCRHYYTPQTEGNTPLATQQNPEKKAPQPGSISNQENTTATPGEPVVTNNPNLSTTHTPVSNNSTAVPVSPPNPALPGSSVAAKPSTRNAGSSFLQKKRNQPFAETSEPDTDTITQVFGSNPRKHTSKTSNHSSSKPGWETGDTKGENTAKQGELRRRFQNENGLVAENAVSATKQNNQTDSLSQTDSARFANKLIDTADAMAAQKAAIKDSIAPGTSALVKKQPQKNKKPASFFYAGLIAGPDYSVVKSSQTAGAGYNAGIIAGYRFGKHLAVETGILWAYKKYRSDGEYASLDNLSLPMHTQIINLNGSCGMYEIPLNVQYHFNSKNKCHWYTSIGLSSYLMKKEEYYYWYRRYNMQYYSEKEYTNSGKNWFSVLQLSGGYQWPVGKHASLRAEPYIKLPVSKIGIAKLPLSSAGINIGYTLPL